LALRGRYGAAVTVRVAAIGIVSSFSVRPDFFPSTYKDGLSEAKWDTFPKIGLDAWHSERTEAAQIALWVGC
jgi:hypothetical protein